MAFFGGHEPGFPDFGVGKYTKSDDFLEKIPNGLRPPPPSFGKLYCNFYDRYVVPSNLVILFWKRGSTSAARNSALNTPFAIHILNRLDMRIHTVASNICHTYTKNSVNGDWVICFLFWLFLVISEVGRPDYVAKSAILILACFGWLFVWNQIVSHRYT